MFFATTMDVLYFSAISPIFENIEKLRPSLVYKKEIDIERVLKSLLNNFIFPLFEIISYMGSC